MIFPRSLRRRLRSSILQILPELGRRFSLHEPLLHLQPHALALRQLLLESKEASILPAAPRPSGDGSTLATFLLLAAGRPRPDAGVAAGAECGLAARGEGPASGYVSWRTGGEDEPPAPEVLWLGNTSVGSSSSESESSVIGPGEPIRDGTSSSSPSSTSSTAAAFPFAAAPDTRGKITSLTGYPLIEKSILSRPSPTSWARATVISSSSSDMTNAFTDDICTKQYQRSAKD